MCNSELDTEASEALLGMNDPGDHCWGFMPSFGGPPLNETATLSLGTSDNPARMIATTCASWSDLDLVRFNSGRLRPIDIEDEASKSVQDFWVDIPLTGNVGGRIDRFCYKISNLLQCIEANRPDQPSGGRA